MITVDQFMDVKSRNKNGQSIHSIVNDSDISRNSFSSSISAFDPA